MALHYAKIQTMIGFGKDKVLMWVARRRLADPFDINRLAKEVSHITGQREAQVLISFQYLIEAVEDALSDGRSVDLGFGTISPAISCTAAEKAEDVEIRKKRVLFRPSKKLRQIVENLSLRLDTYADEDDEETPDDDDIIIDDGEGDGGSGSGDSTLAAPTISGDTTFTESAQVTITGPAGATLHYTTDGTTPTAESPAYSEPLTLSATTTVKAIAVKDGQTSDVASRTFTKSSGGGTSGGLD